MIEDLNQTIKPKIESEVRKQTADLRSSAFMDERDKGNNSVSTTGLERKVDKTEFLS